jgi:predicted Zn finger-like uncharacterized protein
MPSQIECPSCARRLMVPDEHRGQDVRCPQCEHTFVAPSAVSAAPLLDVPLKLALDEPARPPRPKPEPPPAPPPARRADPVPTARRRPRDDDEPRWETCACCGEDVRRGARVCRVCGETLDGTGRTGGAFVRRDCEPHRGGTVQSLGIGSIVSAFLYVFPVGLPLGIAAWVMARRDLKKMGDGVMDPAGMSSTRAGLVCGVVGTVLNTLWTAGAVGLILLIALENSTPSTMAAGGAGRGVVTPPPPMPPPPPPPANALTLSGPAQPVVLRAGESRAITVSVRRDRDLRQNIDVSAVINDPRGVTVTPADVKVLLFQPGEVRLTLRADADAAPGERRVWVFATAVNGEQAASLHIVVQVEPAKR